VLDNLGSAALCALYMTSMERKRGRENEEDGSVAELSMSVEETNKSVRVCLPISLLPN
jgi:hypothetical protein